MLKILKGLADPFKDMPKNEKLICVMIVLMAAGFFFSKGLMNVGFFGATLGGFLVLLSQPKKFKVVPPPGFFLMAICFLGLVLMEFLAWKFSPYARSLTSDDIQKEIRLGWVLLSPFVLVPWFEHSWSRLKTILIKILILGVLFLGVVGCVQWLFLIFNLTELPYRKPFIERPSYGFHNMAILYSYQLFPGLLLILLGMGNSNGFLRKMDFYKKWKYLIWAATVTGIIGIIGSGNRVTLALLLFLFPLQWLRINFKCTLKIFFLVAILAGLAVFFTPAGKRIKNYKTDQGFTHRALLWKAHWQSFLEHPLLGVGRRINNQPLNEKLMSPQEIQALENRTYYNAHNTYLDVLSSLGIFGFILFFTYIFYLPAKAFLKYFKSKNSEHQNADILFTLGIIYFGFFGAAWTENIFNANHNRLAWVWLFSGILFLGFKIQNHKPKTSLKSKSARQKCF